MKNLSLEQHKKRIDNINHAEQANKQYLRRHRIREYLAGQATYNLGDYPARFSIEPTEYDYDLLKDMAQNGVQLIQIHEEWNDAIRHLGADKFTSHDPAGLQKFVDLCHSFGIKIIPYISTGYFSALDPEFKTEFARAEYDLISSHFHYRRCYAGSPAWREYMLPRTIAALDKYGFDGIYNDWGYDGTQIAVRKAMAEGIDVKTLAVYDMPYDPELEDLLGIIYHEIKKRGGVYKIHADRNNTTPCKDKVYDYLWIGENVVKESYGIGKDYEPYIVPCQDASSTNAENPDAYYVKTIPFMQFPLLKRGRPAMGSGIHEDIPYDTRSFGHKHRELVEQYMKEHPDGPYVYSHWSSIPDDVEEYPRWCRYFGLYSPMVEENSVAYIELRESEDILSPIPKKVFASMFVGNECYLVVSNLENADYTLALRDEWIDRESGKSGKQFVLPPTSILFLRRR